MSRRSYEPSERAAGPAGAAREVTLVAHHVGPVGGMERILSELALGLERDGYGVTVIGYGCELPADSQIVFRRVRGPSRPFVLSYPWFLLAGTLATRRWRRGLVQAMGAIVLNRVDVIAVQYCQQVGPATASRASFLFRLNVKAAALIGKVAERICFAVDRPKRMACASDGVAAEIRTYFPRLADRTLAIPNGVDLDVFNPGAHTEQAGRFRAELKLDEGRLLAIFVGSEWERKGLEPVIRALALADGWDLLVVGGGDEERYRAIAAGCGVGERVHWHGVSRDVAPLLAAADAFVFPTSYEGFPLVSLEAAASGLPILASPVNGVTELVEPGVNGYLISREPGDIAARLRALREDPELRRRMGEAARARSLDYSWAKMVRRHEQLYETLQR